MDYMHGAYGQVNTAGSRVSGNSLAAITYVGTAPVHMVEGGAANVNVPIVVNNISDAKKYFGYSEDYASYTLMEAIHVHLEENGVGPLVLINVLNPATHKKQTGGSVSLTPENGQIVIASAADIVLDSIDVKTQDETPIEKVKGTDYAVTTDFTKNTITLTEITSGALGSAALTITYDIVDPSAVANADVIGSSDGLGLNTGIYAVKNVYSITGYIPAFIAAPGFSSVKAIHDVMKAVSKKINGHWDAYMFVDLPIANGSTPLTLDTVVAYKNANGYTAENETVYFPLAEGIDGKKYHLSVLAAANFQDLLLEQEGIPYRSASNTIAALISNLYLGEANVGRVFDDSIVNEKLNKNGIASAVYMGGAWRIWGAHSADYNQSNASAVNVAETNRMMLYYISNDFQIRRVDDVDRPTTMNDLQMITAEEQTRLDALVGSGALLFGEVSVNASLSDSSDIMNGDFSFAFNVTTTPLAKSLTAYVVWTDAGLSTYFETNE